MADSGSIDVLGLLGFIGFIGLLKINSTYILDLQRNIKNNQKKKEKENLSFRDIDTK